MEANSVKISGVIIAYNEEANIARCLQSLQNVCDEIVVIDSFSNDKTEQICAEFGVHFIQNAFEGHIAQKNFAISQANFDVVLSLDADEALSPELQKSILAVKDNWQADAYAFNRFNNYCGQWIKHCGWYPDRKIRLLEKTKGAWGGTDPHDTITLKPGFAAKKLDGDLLHYSYNSMEEHMLRAIKYAKIAAKAMHKRGKKTTILQIIGSPLWRFVQDYFIQLGFLDGFYGFVICVTNAQTAFLKYAYLRNLQVGKGIEG